MSEHVPHGWRELSLSDIVDPASPIVYGIVQAGPHVEDGVPYIKSTNVGGTICVEQLSKTSEDIAKKYLRAECRPGDIVFSLRGNIGNLSFVPINLHRVNLTQGTARIRVGKAGSAAYVANYLKGTRAKSFIEKAAKGSTFQEISLEQLRKVPVLLPPLPEQRRIAAILSQWDDSLSILSRLIEAKRQQKRGLAEALLTGKRRLPGFEGEWEEKVLGQVSFINPSDDLSEHQGCFVKMEDVSDEGILTRVSKNTSSQIGLAGFSRFRNNDTLLAKITPCFENGKGALVRGIEGIGLGSTEFFVLRAKPDINSQWLYFHTRRQEFSLKGISSMQGSGGQRRVPRNFIEKFKILVPSLAEQQAIASVLSTLDEEISALERLRASVQAQKRGLMDLLLTGRVRVGVEAGG